MRQLERTNANLSKKSTDKLKPLDSPFLETMKRIQQDKQTALLLDTSGSMHSYTFAGGTRIEALRKIVYDLPHRLRKFSFASYCNELTTGDIPTPGGATELALGFNTVKIAGVKHVILITDGEPTDQPELTRRERILDACKDLRVDIFYVGDADDPPQILKDIANQCGGKFNACDIELGRLEITSSIQALLEAKK